MNIGIDKINFYTPGFFVDMVDLAHARDVDPNKFTIGIGQDKMAVPPISQDTVTMAANAAVSMLDEDDLDKIDMVILGTESGIDSSKAAAIYVHHLLGIQSRARAFEIKQACYGATAGLQMAKEYVKNHPDRKVLVLGSDIARYGLNTGGEATQGAGAIAMLIAANPRILNLHDDNTLFTEDIMDFWRPTYSETAMVNGKFSNEQYIRFFNEVWSDYQTKTGATLDDFAALCFHLPYTKMGKKALDTVIDTASEKQQAALLEYYRLSTLYSREIGNIYTGSLYLGFISLLEHQTDLKAGDKLGFFSYGSGAVGEFFTGTLAENFEKHLNTDYHEKLLANRKQLSIPEYEKIFLEELPTDGSTVRVNYQRDNAPIVLTGITEHMREYLRQK